METEGSFDLIGEEKRQRGLEEVTMVMGSTGEAFEVLLSQQLHKTLARSLLGALQPEVENQQLPKVVEGHQDNFRGLTGECSRYPTLETPDFTPSSTSCHAIVRLFKFWKIAMSG